MKEAGCSRVFVGKCRKTWRREKVELSEGAFSRVGIDGVVRRVPGHHAEVNFAAVDEAIKKFRHDLNNLGERIASQRKGRSPYPRKNDKLLPIETLLVERYKQVRDA